MMRWLAPALTAVLTAGLMTGADVRPAAGAQAGTALPVDRVDSLSALGRYQEAAWAARAVGDSARAEVLLLRLDSILDATPRSARPLSFEQQGVSYTWRLDHAGGVESIFKKDGSDMFCPECGAEREVAVYRIDRLLGFDMTPLTRFGQVVRERGDTLRGSVMYFLHGATGPADVGAEKPDRLHLFDAIIGNSDRHQGNWLILGDGRVAAIDHNRAFEYHPSTRPKTCWETEVDAIERPSDLGEPYRRYRTLPADSLLAAVEDLLEPELAREFVAMRDRVVQRIEARIGQPDARIPRTDCPWEP